LAATQPEDGTQTDLGINEAVKMLTSGNSDEQRVNVLTVFTDGQSNDPELTMIAANKAQAAGITTFSIGIGSGINQEELLVIAANRTDHVVSVNSFETLVELVYGLNSEACAIPQKPKLNDTITDTVMKDEIRYYRYSVPEEGITVIIDSLTGKTGKFYSISVETPSSALNDGVFSNNVFIPTTADPGLNQVYVAVQGLEDKNGFTIKALEGDHSSAGNVFSSGFLIATLYVINQLIL